MLVVMTLLYSFRPLITRNLASLLPLSLQISHCGPWCIWELDFFLSTLCIFCSVFVLLLPSPMFNTDKTLLE